jgi:hypothetical protein
MVLHVVVWGEAEGVDVATSAVVAEMHAWMPTEEESHLFRFHFC